MSPSKIISKRRIYHRDHSCECGQLEKQFGFHFKWIVCFPFYKGQQLLEKTFSSELVVCVLIPGIELRNLKDLKFFTAMEIPHEK
jgi:hypothetical protein